MNGKVCIVTGGNTGIGKETARGLAQRGAKVVLACRDTGRGESARDDIARSTGRKDVEVIALDLGSKASIRAFGERFRAAHERLDVLVNNAGVWRNSRGTTEDGIEATFGVNHVGTWLLTQDLLPLLKKSAPSRIVVLSSKLHYRGRMDWEDLQFERRKYGTTAAYAQSKLANVLFTKALARRLEGTGVTVNAVHPGVVRTDLMRDYPKLLVKLFNLFLLTPERGAECSLHVATAPELAGVTGEYFEKSRIKPAAAEALDEAAQERLWALTEALAA
ncbi:SDR family oxidoreductase [Sorangium atrum]|uniref:SDR family oxidoreductase n=1 Tax=Sorangium atrum TaxID=2995308 RepID=A0ABT5BVT0_9BACT|nr:SDR family oxidoreductase [Sorangium aterium]MDC0677543.1 SDR family oxidoreductase [Sorangium aterium]